MAKVTHLETAGKPACGTAAGFLFMKSLPEFLKALKPCLRCEAKVVVGRCKLQIRDDMKPGYYLSMKGHFYSVEKGKLDDVTPTRFRNIAAARLAAKDGQEVVEVA